MYSVIYDPINREPFGIIESRAGIKTAHPIDGSASNWAVRYNGGDKKIPYGLASSEFVEMDHKFTDSFKSAFTNSKIKAVEKNWQRNVTIVTRSIKAVCVEYPIQVTAAITTVLRIMLKIVRE